LSGQTLLIIAAPSPLAIAWQSMLVDPARIPPTRVQVFLRELSAEAPLDAGEVHKNESKYRKIGKRNGCSGSQGMVTVCFVVMVPQSSSRSIGPPDVCAPQSSHVPLSQVIRSIPPDDEHASGLLGGPFGKATPFTELVRVVVAVGRGDRDHDRADR
jgi:hypothetical protein